MLFDEIDQNLTCRECKQPFVFTAGEQNFFNKKGLDKAPVRCKDCRADRKLEKLQDGGATSDRGSPPVASYEDRGNADRGNSRGGRGGKGGRGRGKSDWDY